MKKKNIGSSFDDWLREEGIYEETTAVAIKRVRERAPKARPIPALGAAQGAGPGQAPKG
jgi:hypothetical protein